MDYNGLNKDNMDTKEEIKQIAYDFTTSKGDCKKLENRILSLFGVSRQRELLIAFHKWQQKMWTNPNSEITENVVDVYLKSHL